MAFGSMPPTIHLTVTAAIAGTAAEFGPAPASTKRSIPAAAPSGAPSAAPQRGKRHVAGPLPRRAWRFPMAAGATAALANFVWWWVAGLMGLLAGGK